ELPPRRRSRLLRRRGSGVPHLLVRGAIHPPPGLTARHLEGVRPNVHGPRRLGRRGPARRRVPQSGRIGRRWTTDSRPSVATWVAASGSADVASTYGWSASIKPES